MPISAKALRENFRDITPENAKELSRRIRNAEYLSSDKERAAVIDFADKVIGGYGVEAIRGNEHPGGYWFGSVAIYVNTGDTYSATVLFDTIKHRYYLTSFGDFVEKNDRKYGIE